MLEESWVKQRHPQHTHTLTPQKSSWRLMLGEAPGSLDPEVCPHLHLLECHLPWKAVIPQEALAEETLGLGEESWAGNKVH